MTYYHNNNAYRLTQLSLYALVFFTLLLSPIANAYMETSAICQSTSADDQSMTMHDAMEDADVAPVGDCCLADVMPECCDDTCQVGSLNMPSALTFHASKLESIQTHAVITQPRSITQPPLLRPPVVS